METVCLNKGLFDSNVYLFADNNSCLLIDAGVPVSLIEKELTTRGWTLSGIVLTHGHVDHICHLEQLRERFAVPIMMHRSESVVFGDDRINGYHAFGIQKSAALPQPDQWLQDGENILFGNAFARVIHTPGHTIGGICLYAEGYLATGDTLFKTSIGRTDLPTGDRTTLLSSIRQKLFTLPSETVVFPGHGPETTIAFERKYNPYVR